jgi:colanic acid biosynthesis glycosyl transferase WcaI
MRVMFLTQWFEPEPAFKGTSFVRGLRELGHDVEVVTGLPNYPTGKIYPGYRLKPYQKEVVEGVTVHRLPLYPSHDKSTAGRCLNYASFFISAFVYGLFASRRFDVVYVYHPPITVGAAAGMFGLFTGTPFVLDVQDLWPDSVFVSGMTGTGFIGKMVGHVCDFTYRRAAAILAQSHGIKAKLVERGVPADKITTIYNWAEEDLVASKGLCDAAELLPSDRFNIVYGGNLGRVQALDTVIEAARRAGESEPKILVTLIGSGTETERLRRFVDDNRLTNVRVLPAVPKTHIADVFRAADVLLSHLADEPLFRITVPSKIQFYLAVGKPILLGVPGEAAELVVSAGAGVAVPPEDPEKLAAAMVDLARRPKEVLQLMGERGQSFYNRKLSQAAAIKASGDVLAGCAHVQKREAVSHAS